MKWDVLENQIRETKVFRSFKNGETFLEDKTMMKTEHESLQKLLRVTKPTNSYKICYIDEARNTQLRNLCEFLNRKSYENEIQILCIMGHGPF